MQTLYGDAYKDSDNKTTENSDKTAEEKPDSEAKPQNLSRVFYESLFEESFRCAGVQASVNLPLYYHTVRCVRRQEVHE